MTARMGLAESFARYGAPLKNVQWSVSAWTPRDELVVSLWAHHYRKGPDGSAEYADTTARWAGPGKNEFVANVNRAFTEKRPVRLVIVSTPEIERVQLGGEARTVPKQFDAREDVVGEVVHWDGVNSVFRFRRVSEK